MQIMTNAGTSSQFNDGEFDLRTITENAMGPAYNTAKKMLEEINSKIKDDAKRLVSIAPDKKLCCYLCILIGTCGLVFCPLICWTFELVKLQQRVKAKLTETLAVYEPELRQHGFTAIIHNKIIFSINRRPEG